MKKFIILSLVTLLISNTITAQTTEIWGMTYSGGTYNIGTIFKTDANGNNLSVQKEFNKIDGSSPNKIFKASNGKLYGITLAGGGNDIGVIFEYDYITNKYIRVHNFIDYDEGRFPCSLIEASNGKFYGMGQQGGVNYDGVIFEFDPATNIYTKKIDFNSVDNGERPSGDLLEASNGKLYGLTNYGGTNNKGVLFEYDYTTNTIINKINFTDTIGCTPTSSLIEASNGKLYGVTIFGGLNNDGVLFEYNFNNNTISKKIDFNDTINDMQPEIGLTEALNGKLYGTTSGGIGGYGTLFEYNINTNTLVTKITFDGTLKGRSPSNLELASDGKLYGNTGSGGINNDGVLFVYDPTSEMFEKKIDFEETTIGRAPTSLVEVTTGIFYGLVGDGGYYSDGVLYKYDATTGIYTKQLDFGDVKEGNLPSNSIMQASNGKFYGLASSGGTNDNGVIFEFNPINNSYTNIYSFERYVTGNQPYGALMQASNGKLYGMTCTGGYYDNGILFEYDINANTFVVKHTFEQGDDGKTPFGSLIQAPNGKLYGMTSLGGSKSGGTIFEYDYTNNIYNRKINFGGYNGEAKYPYGSLLLASNGKMYGLTTNGGGDNAGVIFEYNYTNNAYTVRYEFPIGYGNGTYPYGSLIQASNGKLYGTTERGGVNNEGVIFEYDYNYYYDNAYTCKIDFDGTLKGKNPLGTLLNAKNGKLYGMTQRGGINNYGVLFEYSPSSNTFVKKHDFGSGFDGRLPAYGHLIEIAVCTNTVSNIDVTSCLNYTTPSGNETYSNIGEYTISDTIPNTCGLDSIINIQLSLIDIIDTTVTLNNNTLISNQNGATYKWYSCSDSSFIAGATNQNYTATENGYYYVEVTVGTCISNSNCIEISHIGIDEVSFESDIAIYPNPSNGVINIELGELKNVSIKVFNTLNQLIYEKQNISTKTYSFKLNNSTGMYVIEFMVNDKKIIKKGIVNSL